MVLSISLNQPWASSWAGRTFVIFIFLTSLSNALGAERTAGHVYSVQELVNNYRDLVGKRISVRGDFVLEPENANLWTSAEKYGEEKGACVSLQISDSLYNRREAYNRRDVYLSGVVADRMCSREGGCVNHCSSLGLTQIWIEKFGKPLAALDASPKAVDYPWVITDPNIPDVRLLRRLAVKLTNAIIDITRDNIGRSAITDLVESSARAAILQGIHDRHSRINWLLFDSPSSLSRVLSQSRIPLQAEIAVQDAAPERREAYICFCTGRHCKLRDLTPQRVYYRAASDPYLCFPARKRREQWYLNDGFLLGEPYEGRGH